MKINNLNCDKTQNIADLISKAIIVGFSFGESCGTKHKMHVIMILTSKRCTYFL